MEFLHLNKSEKDKALPILFVLLYDNMNKIAPSDLSYSEERDFWIAAVSSGLEKNPRQIILCVSNGQTIGFLQYYLRDKMLMIEEIQISKPFQQTTLFFSLLRFLKASLPARVQTVEAYADKRNLYSRELMKRIGMVVCESNDESPFVHMRGVLSEMSFARKFIKAGNTFDSVR